jgi:hypothetical protein
VVTPTDMNAIIALRQRKAVFYVRGSSFKIITLIELTSFREEKALPITM